MSANTGGPAFPALHIPDMSPPAWNGMTLRDYFAAKAMESLVLKFPLIVQYEDEECEKVEAAIKNRREIIAHSAYDYADAMLAEREKGGAK